MVLSLTMCQSTASTRIALCLQQHCFLQQHRALDATAQGIELGLLTQRMCQL
jgi:hypothetical protein